MRPKKAGGDVIPLPYRSRLPRIKGPVGGVWLVLYCTAVQLVNFHVASASSRWHPIVDS